MQQASLNLQNYICIPRGKQCEVFEYNNFESLETIINKKHDYYAVMVEPFSASSLYELSDEFLIKLRKICTEYNIVLIYDEVYTGWGKTGSLMNFMRQCQFTENYAEANHKCCEKFTPDILCKNYRRRKSLNCWIYSR